MVLLELRKLQANLRLLLVGNVGGLQIPPRKGLSSTGTAVPKS
jgi:hypothetical protein